MYFRNFPKNLYSFDLSGASPTTVTNIFSRFSFNSTVLNNAFAFYKYQLTDGDTPEIVASKVYNDPTLHWVICLANNLSDPLFDLPLSQDALERKILKQYGYASIAEAYSTIHHYVLEVKNTLAEVDGATTVKTSNNIVTLQQYDYTSNTLITRNTGSSTTTVYHFHANNSNVATANTATLTVVETYKPVYVYDYENGLNESKRAIKILKSEYIGQLTLELETVLNG